MFGIGPAEMMLVGLISLLLFGNRVPEVMRSLGRGISEFKKGISSVDDEIRQAGVSSESVARIGNTNSQ